MINEFALQRERFDKKNKPSKSNKSKIKEIANDSLFYFGIFFTLILLLNSLPFVSGLVEEYNIGINEVIVASIGFLNIFFIKIIKGMLSR